MNDRNLRTNSLTSTGRWGILALSVGLPLIGIAMLRNPQSPPEATIPADGNQLIAAEALNAFPIREWPSDYPMFGGTPSRNLVNLIDKNIPGKFAIEDVLLWKVKLGSRAYGGPTIARGKIFVGTNNDNPRNMRDHSPPNVNDPMGRPIDRGILMCFEEKTGKFLWQAVHDKLRIGIVQDWPGEGICSTPIVEGDRVYYVSNQCRVVCADIHGFANGNDGFQDEKYKSETDADIIWEFDMVKELGVFPHNMSNCSPLIVGDNIFVITSNGVDEGHINLPAPDAPSFLALNKKTGKVVWKDASPGKNIMHSQWSSPAYGIIKGVPQVIFPGGDGWIYAFKPETGELLWKFDANPKDSKYDLGGGATRGYFTAMPAIYNERVYIGIGQDSRVCGAASAGIGHFWCIDPAGKKGDISPDLATDMKSDPPKTKPNPNSGAVWQYGGVEKRPHARRQYVLGTTVSTACIIDDFVYIAEIDGYLHCLEAKTGKKYWQFDAKSEIEGSAYYTNGKIFLGTTDGDLIIFKHDKIPESLDEVELASKAKDEAAAKKIVVEVRKKVDQKYKLARIEIEHGIHSTPIVANGVLYVMTENTLYAFKKKE